MPDNPVNDAVVDWMVAAGADIIVSGDSRLTEPVPMRHGFSDDLRVNQTAFREGRSAERQGVPVRRCNITPEFSRCHATPYGVCHSTALVQIGAVRCERSRGSNLLKYA